MEPPFTDSKQDSWWKRRTKLERHLSCIALGMLILAVILFISLIFYRQYGVPKGVCLTPDCVQAASQILKKLEDTVDPCEDFYDFACGGFHRKTTIPDDAFGVNSFEELGAKVMVQLRYLLEEPVDPTEVHVAKLAKTYYKSCMNEEYINREGLIEAQTLLNSLGGWPVLEEAWDSTGSFDWIDTVVAFKEKGLDFNYLISVSAGKDYGDSTKRIINIDQPPAFGLGSHQLQKGIHESSVKGYLQLMVDFAVMFGANDFRASEELEEALNFEIKLAKSTVFKAESRNTSQYYNKMSLKSLQQQYGSIDWIKLLKNILPENAKLYDEREVLIEVPSYVDALEKILKTTPSKTIANYLVWRVVLELWQFLPHRFEQRIIEFHKSTNGLSQSSPRWVKCLGITKQHFPIMLSATYVRRFFTNDIKEYGEEMVNLILESFEKYIENEASWMDPKTKTQALEKVQSIIPNVAFPIELYNDQLLDKLYSGIYVSDKLFLQSFLNINKFEWNKMMNKLVEPVQRNDWRERTMPITINAFYYLTDNTINVPAAIMQGNFLDKNRPSYLNFGAIGSIVGHEFVHAFDDQGSQFDKTGNLKNWWDEETRIAFAEKARCFVDKFNNIRIEEVKQNVSGIRTLGENIADNGGTKQAYLAYDAWTDKHGEENKLPGLDYSPRQMFWISAAQNWCSKQRLEYLKMKLAIDPHAPEKYRVNANFQNLEQFAKDFKCPLGSNMNPKTKCSLW